MRKLLPILSALILIPAAPASATAAPAPSAGVTTVTAPAGALLARGFGSRGYRSRGYGRRYGTPRRTYGRPYRRGIGRGFFGGVLKALGIAYLFHMLFGWGSGGGSPIMLFVLLGLFMWFVTRRRRRPQYF